MTADYQKQTGIAGYSLLNNSYGFQLLTHQPFISIDYLFNQQTDMTAIKRVVDKVEKRTLIKDTTIGEQIQLKKQQLHEKLNCKRPITRYIENLQSPLIFSTYSG